MIHRRHFTRACLAACLVASLTACDYLPDWMGKEEEDAPLPGNRVAVLPSTTSISADPALATMEVRIPEAAPIADWPQAGGNPGNVMGNLVLEGALSLSQSARIGEGNDWPGALVPDPVVAAGIVYAMDAKGYITAHDAKDIGKTLWTSKSAVEKEDADILGGGLAFEAGRLFVTTGYGHITAIDATTGQEVWTKNLGTPLRAAPRIFNGILYALSVDNQLFALAVSDGGSLWSHRGISESAGFLGGAVPSVQSGILVAPYSSGEITALQAESGQELWSDNLAQLRQTTASASFTGIGGNPVIEGGVVYAVSDGGMLAATVLRDGRRIWEQPISSSHTPWLAGEFLYVLGGDGTLAAIWTRDGRVRWTTALAVYGDPEKKKDPITWYGPVMAGNRLLMVNDRSELRVISPFTGETESTHDVPGDIATAPVVAGGVIYLVGKNGDLYAMK